jgi:hypothetical protein
MAGSLLPQPKQTFTDDAGKPLVGGQIYTYAAGTLTPKATYQDAALTIANTNPVIANARGEVIMYGAGTYRLILKDKQGNTLWDRDNIESVASAVGAQIGGLSGGAGASLVGYQQSGTGAAARTVQDKLRESVSVKDFGAKGDGTTDDAPAFRAAAAYLESFGGGTLRVPAGTYKCSSTDPDMEWPKDERHIVYIGSNTVIEGDRGAVFWLDGDTLCKQTLFTTGGNRFNCIGIKKGARFSAVRGLRFTTNGWVLDIGFRTCFGVTVGGDDCEVSGNYFDNMPGHNMIGVGYNNPSWPAYNYLPAGIVIKGNTFKNGSKNVPGNANANDCSFVYLNSLGAVVSDNRFYNESEAVINCGGVELHGSNIHVRNNTFTNLYPAIYTGWQTADGKVSEGNEITGNTFTTCAGGIQTIDEHSGLVISGNTFVNVLATSAAKNYGLAIYSTLLDSGVSGGACVGTKISGNHFRESVPTYKAAINVAGLQASIIAENTFDGIINCINIPGASDVVANGIEVRHNVATNPPASPAYYSALVCLNGSDTFASTVKNVVARGNMLLAGAGTINTSIGNASGTQSTLSNVVFSENTTINAQDAILGTQAAQVIFEAVAGVDFPTAWTQSSGLQPAIGNGAIKFVYQRRGKKVDVWFRLAAGSATVFGNSAAPWEFSLPFTASAQFAEQNAVVEVYDGASGTTMVSVLVPGSGTKFRMNYNGQTVRKDWPVTSTAALVIHGQFSYLVD